MQRYASWTKPYCGVQHLGKLDCESGYRATITQYKKFTLLHKWYPDCGFHPIEETFDAVQEARVAAEKYVTEHGYTVTEFSYTTGKWKIGNPYNLNVE